MPPTSPLSDFACLREAWTPINRAHRGARRYSEGVHLRIYRSLSWADRANALDERDDADFAFILKMIAFNALWGRDHPPGPRPSQAEDWTRLLMDLHRIDARGRLVAWFDRDREILDSIYESPFFHREYWSEPGSERLGGQPTISGKVDGWIRDGRFERLLPELTRRMLLLRGQLMHGNATHGGNVNRDTVVPAAAAVDRLLRVSLEILVLDGGHEAGLEWDPVPYPPVGRTDAAPQSNPSDSI